MPDIDAQDFVIAEKDGEVVQGYRKQIGPSDVCFEGQRRRHADIRFCRLLSRRGH
jgi:hypothetical protein